MPIRWDKFTVKAQEAVQRANELASEHGNPELQPIHLLAALLEDKEGIVPPVLEKIGIGPQAVLSAIYGEIEKLPKVSGQASQATLSNEANKLLETEEKGGVITEDELNKGKEQVQELIKQYETKVDEMIEHKRSDVMTV